MGMSDKEMKVAVVGEPDYGGVAVVGEPVPETESVCVHHLSA